MKPFTLLIKPTSADCNLHCPYCFYLDRSGLYPETKRHRMSDKVLEQMISTYMATDQQQYTFGWQGGEPTLMGVDFFRRTTDLQKKYGKKGDIVGNGLQTNATLIDDEFAKLLSEYKFLIGVSIDGPAEIHDFYRTTIDGRGSHKDVLQGINCLKRNNVEYNALTLVSSANVKKGKEVYNYLCEMGFLYHQYIPCIEFDDKSQPREYTITGQEWGDFLCEIFDVWKRTDTRRISIRLFDSILTLMVQKTYNVCHMGRNCCQYFVVEYNGDIYPCDFFVESERKFGNIMTNSWAELLKSQKYLDFGKQKSQWNNQCTRCKYLTYCVGDCLKHRIYGGNSPKQLSWLCDGWKQFYEHSITDFEKLAESIKKEMQNSGGNTSTMSVPGHSDIGRNDPCPCGSGKKYKKCCGF